MSELQQQGFNYGQLAPLEATEVRAASERIKIRMKRTAEDIVAIGQDLIATKERLGHGLFESWIKTEFDMSLSSSKRLMSVAERFGKSPNLGDMNLTPSIIYQLAENSTPDEVVGKVIEAKQAGESVTTADVKKWKEEAIQAQQQAEEMKTVQAEQNRKITELQAQQQEASARLERAKEEYLKLKNKEPEIQIIEKEIVPKPYVSLEQALQGKRNLMEEAETAMRKAKAEEQRARDEIGKLKVELIKERQIIDKARNERSSTEDANLKISLLTTTLIAFLRQNEEAFLAINSDYLQYADTQMLKQVEDRLREIADKIANARGVSNEYAEFRVVNA